MQLSFKLFFLNGWLQIFLDLSSFYNKWILINGCTNLIYLLIKIPCNNILRYPMWLNRYICWRTRSWIMLGVPFRMGGTRWAIGLATGSKYFWGIFMKGEIKFLNCKIISNWCCCWISAIIFQIKMMFIFWANGFNLLFIQSIIRLKLRRLMNTCRNKAKWEIFYLFIKRIWTVGWNKKLKVFLMNIKVVIIQLLW